MPKIRQIEKIASTDIAETIEPIEEKKFGFDEDGKITERQNLKQIVVDKQTFDSIVADVQKLKEINERLMEERENKQPFHLRKKKPIVHTARLKLIEEGNFLIIGFKPEPRIVYPNSYRRSEMEQYYMLKLMDKNGEITEKEFELLEWSRIGKVISCNILSRNTEEVEISTGQFVNRRKLEWDDYKETLLPNKVELTTTHLKETLTVELPPELEFKNKTLTLEARVFNAYC